MMTLKRPTDESIHQMLNLAAESPPTYKSSGIENAAPRGFNKDTASFRLGTGRKGWEAAKLAIEDWAIFPTEMVSMVRLSDKIEVGTTVAVLFQGLGILTINPARIHSVTNEVNDEFHRFGFTYVTLQGHAECGEELFCVQWNKATDKVTYELVAISKPNHILARLGYFYSRMMQARFRKLSGKSMQEFVSKNGSHETKVG